MDRIEHLGHQFYLGAWRHRKYIVGEMDGTPLVFSLRERLSHNLQHTKALVPNHQLYTVPESCKPCLCYPLFNLRILSYLTTDSGCHVSLAKSKQFKIREQNGQLGRFKPRWHLLDPFIGCHSWTTLLPGMVFGFSMYDEVVACYKTRYRRQDHAWRRFPMCTTDRSWSNCLNRMNLEGSLRMWKVLT